MDAASRLRAARIAAGYVEATAAAEAMGVPPPTYLAHENGSRGFPAQKAKRYADFFSTTADWLLYGGAPAPPRRGRRAAEYRTIPVVGYVGAASEFIGFDDHEKGVGLDEIEAPAGTPHDAVAVIVRGDSGYPAIRDGMILVYWNKLEDPSSVVGEDCFVRVKDGRTLVKLLERGSEPGKWTLVSINSSVPPIRDVEIEWAAPIEIRLRRKNWKAAG